MTKPVLWSFLCALLSLGCPTTGKQQPAPEVQLSGKHPDRSRTDTTRLMTILFDGSRIIGRTTLQSIAVQTAYAKTEIPFNLLLSASRNSAGSPFTVATSNGDRFQATPVLETIDVETLLGRISLPISAVASLTVVREAAGPTDGLAALYTFEGDTKDRSGHHRDGILHGPVLTADRHGLPDHAYFFDGRNSRIELPTGIIKPTIPVFTVCAWVLAHTVNQERIVVYTGTRLGESVLNAVNGTFGFGVKCSDGSWYTVHAPAVTEQYVFVVGIFVRGKVVQLWLNGERKAEASVPDLGLYPGPPMVSGSIGSYQTETENPDHVWDGVMDEVRIYDRALSQSEIEGMYAAGR